MSNKDGTDTASAYEYSFTVLDNLINMFSLWIGMRMKKEQGIKIEGKSSESENFEK